ncbi:Spindle pole body component alp16 [Schizosaccharomyces pombe]
MDGIMKNDLLWFGNHVFDLTPNSFDSDFVEQLSKFEGKEGLKRKLFDSSEYFQNFSFQVNDDLLGKDVILDISNQQLTPAVPGCETSSNSKLISASKEITSERKRAKSSVSPSYLTDSSPSDLSVENKVLLTCPSWDGENFKNLEARSPFISEAPSRVYDYFLHNQDWSPKPLFSALQVYPLATIFNCVAGLPQGFESTVFPWNKTSSTFELDPTISVSGMSDECFASIVQKFSAIGGLIKKALNEFSLYKTNISFYLSNFIVNGVLQYRKEFQRWLRLYEFRRFGLIGLSNFVNSFSSFFELISHFLKKSAQNLKGDSLLDFLFDYARSCQNTISYPIALQCLIYCSNPYFKRLELALKVSCAYGHIDSSLFLSLPRFFPSELCVSIEQCIQFLSLIREQKEIFNKNNKEFINPLNIRFAYSFNDINQACVIEERCNFSSLSFGNLEQTSVNNDSEEFETLLAKMNMTPDSNDNLLQLKFTDDVRNVCPLDLNVCCCIAEPIQSFILSFLRSTYKVLKNDFQVFDLLNFFHSTFLFQNYEFSDNVISLLKSRRLDKSDHNELAEDLNSDDRYNFISRLKKFIFMEKEKNGLSRSLSKSITFTLDSASVSEFEDVYPDLQFQCQVIGALRILFTDNSLNYYSKTFSYVLHLFQAKSDFESSVELKDRSIVTKTTVMSWSKYQGTKESLFQFLSIYIPECMLPFTKLLKSIYSPDRPTNIQNSAIKNAASVHEQCTKAIYQKAKELFDTMKLWESSIKVS